MNKTLKELLDFVAKESKRDMNDLKERAEKMECFRFEKGRLDAFRQILDFIEERMKNDG